MQDSLLNGRSSVFGAMCWMTGLSLLLNIALCWVPVIGHLAAGIIAGYIGGRRAGTVGRAFLAAVLPCALLFFVCSGAGLLYGAGAREPGLGGLVGLAVGGVAGMALLLHHGALIVAALVGGAQRQSEPF